MKRFTIFLLVVLGVNAYGFKDPEPAYKYEPCWILPEEGTPSFRVLSKKEEERKAELLKKFQERYPEYTLSYDREDVLKEIKASAQVAFIENPIFTGTYTQESLFSEFEDLFGIGTECLHSIGTREPKCSLGDLFCLSLTGPYPCPYHRCIYRGLPVYSERGNFVSGNFVQIAHIPDASGTLGDLTGEKGTWSLTINYPYQIKELDLTPTITGTQAVEIMHKDLYDWFNWPSIKLRGKFPSKEEYIERYLPYYNGNRKPLEYWYEKDKVYYESRKKKEGGKDIGFKPIPSFEEFLKSQPYSISDLPLHQQERKLEALRTRYENDYIGIRKLCIFIHKDGKPYLAWQIKLGVWLFYIDAKRGKILYGHCIAYF
jgi:hypothetical protein